MKVEITEKHKRAHNGQPQRPQVQFKVGQVVEGGVDISSAMAESIVKAKMGKAVKAEVSEFDSMGAPELKVLVADADGEYTNKPDAIAFLKGLKGQ